jgi:hypothetical protein
VILLDAYALVAFLVGGPAAPHVRMILREGDAGVATANLAEALDVTERVYRVPVARTIEVVEPLLGDVLTAVPLDVPTALRAAEMRARHYHRSSLPISLADAVLVASASASDHIATADPDVLAVAHKENVETVVLPGQG